MVPAEGIIILLLYILYAIYIARAILTMNEDSAAVIVAKL
jgi:hypothetical protein